MLPCSRDIPGEWAPGLDSARAGHPHATAGSDLDRDRERDTGARGKRLLAAGVVASIRIDGSRRIPLAALETYIAGRLRAEDAA